MSDYLIHYGVKGMKWGVRKRYYNSDGSLNNKGRKKYIKAMYKDMDRHFQGQISNKYARRTSFIQRNGHVAQGSSWNTAYRKGRVGSKDATQVRNAASNTRTYMIKKYGESAFDSLQKSGVLGRPVSEFDVKVSYEDLMKERRK